VGLTPQTVDSFIERAIRADSADRLRIAQEIARASDDTVVVRELARRLTGTGIRDLGTSLVIVGILGEMRNRRTLRPLDSVVWQPMPRSDTVRHGELNERDLVEMLASKAVEAVAYLRADTSDALTLRVIREHPSKLVRGAAIDAYLYNHGDSSETRERLRGLVRPEDRSLLDRARRSRSSSRDAFNLGLEQFYRRYPNEVAPPPGQARKSVQAKDTSAVAPAPPPRRPQR
jgi:hypothetical protein